MMRPMRSPDITGLLKAWRGGDPLALERLTPLVYDQLRKLGRQYVRKERAGEGTRPRWCTKRSCAWWMRGRSTGRTAPTS
jgi:hypothetical protein